jgi:predicted dehydrogenase
VRWTEGRNLEAVIDLLAAERLKVADLVTHTFDIGDAAAAYRMMEEHKDPYMAIRLTYPSTISGERPVSVRTPEVVRSTPGVGWIGAGSFSAGTLLPAFRAAGFERFVAITSASGLSALRLAERNNFEEAVSGAQTVIDHVGVDVVVIATPHDIHAELGTLALKGGRHVWCEKPPALTSEELDAVEAAWAASGRQLMIGFNRRWSPAVLASRRALDNVPAPKFIVYRVAAGPIPEGHWYTDRRQGGRLLGEVCHFVDTTQALVGSRIEESVSVLGGQSSGEPGNDAVVSLRFADGSLATICYGSNMSSTGKEWIEISAGSHRIVIDDFKSASFDGRTLWKGKRDKGHRAQAIAFWQAIRGASVVPTESMLATMAATIRAATGAVSEVRAGSNQ